MRDISLRPAKSDDNSFLFAVFAASHPEFDQLPLPEEQKQYVIRSQYQAQTGDYSARFPDSNHDIIIDGGEPVGRLWVARLDDEIRIVDMGLIATARNSGIGSLVMKRLQMESAQCGKPLRSSVFRFNEGSLRWHERLGFVPTHEDTFMIYMQWNPPAG